MTPVVRESMLGYHPCDIGFLTSRRDPAVGQCQAGSLTGAVASERVSEAPKVSLRMVGTIRRVQRQKETYCDTDGWSRYESQGLVIRWY